MKLALPILAILLFTGFRDDPKELVLLGSMTVPHPEIILETSGNVYREPEVTLLQIGTRDGKEKYFIRGAVSKEDAGMMFRTQEPVERQFRRPVR